MRCYRMVLCLIGCLCLTEVNSKKNIYHTKRQERSRMMNSDSARGGVDWVEQQFRQAAKELFLKLDTDLNAKVSRMKLINFFTNKASPQDLQKELKMNEEQMRAIMGHYDVDADGLYNGQEADKIINDVDINGDDMVEIEELLSFAVGLFTSVMNGKRGQTEEEILHNKKLFQLHYEHQDEL